MFQVSFWFRFLTVFGFFQAQDSLRFSYFSGADVRKSSGFFQVEGLFSVIINLLSGSGIIQILISVRISIFRFMFLIGSGFFQIPDLFWYRFLSVSVLFQLQIVTYFRFMFRQNLKESCTQ
jgi:hypothetical protein